MAYKAVGEHNDANVSAEDREKIKALAKQYEAAKAAGDTAGMDSLHQQAEQIRAGYGYSGGEDGSQKIEKPTNVSGGYTPLGEYNDAPLDAEDRERIAALRKQYETAKAAGDTAMMDSLHQQAEQIRAVYEYSGGEDGSQLIHKPKDLSGATPYTPGKILGGELQDDRINKVYDTGIDLSKAALDAAYQQNVIDLDAAQAKIPEIYQNARNQTAGAAAVQRANFNEYAAASGLNSGAGGQAQLAMGNQLQGDLSRIDREEAGALNDLETQRLKLKTQYQNDVAQAILQGEYDRAAALAQEGQRVDELLLSKSQAQESLNLQAWAANKQDLENKRAQYQGLVNNLLSLGIQPSQEMLEVAGVPKEYVTAMLGAVSSGGGGSSSGRGPVLPGGDQSRQYFLNTDQTTEEYDAYTRAVNKWRKDGSVANMSELEIREFVSFWDGGQLREAMNAYANNTATEAQIAMLKKYGILK